MTPPPPPSPSSPQRKRQKSLSPQPDDEPQIVLRPQPQHPQLQHPQPQHPQESSDQQQPHIIHNATQDEIYWDSPEARKFFGYYKPETKDEDEYPVSDIMHDRIIMLRKAALTSSGWREVLEDRDIENHCNAQFIFQIQRKAKFLSQALAILYNN